MKIREIFLIGAVLLSTFSCHESQNINIKVVDNDETYRYTADFPRSKSRLVEKFINNHIAPSSISYDNVVDITTTLDDKTKFEYEASPGELRIELDKHANNPASYVRIKKMCEDLNQIINPKK